MEGLGQRAAPTGGAQLRSPEGPARWETKPTTPRTQGREPAASQGAGRQEGSGTGRIKESGRELTASPERAYGPAAGLGSESDGKALTTPSEALSSRSLERRLAPPNETRSKSAPSAQHERGDL